MIIVMFFYFADEDFSVLKFVASETDSVCELVIIVLTIEDCF